MAHQALVRDHIRVKFANQVAGHVFQHAAAAPTLQRLEAQDVKLVMHLPVQTDGAVEMGIVRSALFTWRHRQRGNRVTCASTFGPAGQEARVLGRNLSSHFELYDSVGDVGARFVWRRIVLAEFGAHRLFHSDLVFPSMSTLPPN